MLKDVAVSIHHLQGRSTVRVRLAFVWVIFLSCCCVLQFATLSPGWQDAILGLAGASAISVFFIRCERCKEPLVSVRPEQISSVLDIMAPQKHCSRCGLERI